jgi:hypothetical protein
MRTLHSFNCILVATVGLSCCGGDVDPVDPTPTITAPPGRAHHGLVYDEVRQRVLLIGGSTPAGSDFQFFNDVWEFDGTEWKLVVASGPRRGGRGLAFDTQRKALFSFGGFANNQTLTELMRLNGTTCETLGTLSERPTVDGGFVCDLQRNRLVLYGGSPGDGQVYSDTLGAGRQQLDAAESDRPESATGLCYGVRLEAFALRSVRWHERGAGRHDWDDVWRYLGVRRCQLAAGCHHRPIAPHCDWPRLRFESRSAARVWRLVADRLSGRHVVVRWQPMAEGCRHGTHAPHDGIHGV